MRLVSLTRVRAHLRRRPRVDFRTGKKYVWLRGEDGELFYDEKDDVRMWKSKGGPKRWLRSVVKRYPALAYKVTDLDGKETLIGITASELQAYAQPDLYGPHEWSKANLVTQQDSHGMYDLWHCKHCKTEMKRYGLSGRPPLDICYKNPRRKGDDSG